MYIFDAIMVEPAASLWWYRVHCINTKRLFVPNSLFLCNACAVVLLLLRFTLFCCRFDCLLGLFLDGLVHLYSLLF